jgi:glycosyltransferase involved in cell wall biosynthesis
MHLKATLIRSLYRHKSITHSKLFPARLEIVARKVFNSLYRGQGDRFIYARGEYDFELEVDNSPKKKSFASSILIDAQGLQGGSFNRGIGRYSRALIKHLAIENPEVRFILMFNNTSNTENINIIVEELSQNRTNVSFALCKLPLDHGKVSELDAIDIMTSFVRTINPDLVLFLSMFEHPFDVIPIRLNLECKTAAVYYDLIPLQFKEMFLSVSDARDVFYANLNRLKSMDILLSISKSSETYLVDRVGYNGTIETIDGGPFFQSPPSTGLELSKRRGILCVGSDSPHKNIGSLIIAYSFLSADLRERHSLNLVGVNESAFTQDIQIVIRTLGNQIKFLKNLSDDDLQVTYRSVRLTVAPSLVEGLGMPILESWNEGCVAIGSRDTSLSDIIGSDQFCFNPHSPANMSDLIEEVLVSDSLWLKELERLIERRSRFEWCNTARKASKALGLK